MFSGWCQVEELKFLPLSVPPADFHQLVKGSYVVWKHFRYTLSFYYLVFSIASIAPNWMKEAKNNYKLTLTIGVHGNVYQYDDALTPPKKMSY